jgi:hypothetical protein
MLMLMLMLATLHRRTSRCCVKTSADNSNRVSGCGKTPHFALLAQERSRKRLAPGKEQRADCIIAPWYAQNQGADSVNNDDLPAPKQQSGKRIRCAATCAGPM